MSLEESVENSGVDDRDGVELKIGVSNEVVVTLKTGSDDGSATAWGTHSSSHDEIFKTPEWLFL